MYTLYGITRCSTVTKAKRFLEAQHCEYQFYDLKKQPLTLEFITELASRVGWEVMLNKRSTTWRNLEDVEKQNMTEQQALDLMMAKPTLIKRPLLDLGEKIIVGFNLENYQQNL